MFRYRMTGKWFKGNTHLHSTASDGGLTFAELADIYASGGYDFLFRTDHWVASDVVSDPGTYPLLWIDGIELDGFDPTGAMYHVVCLGTLEGMDRDKGFMPCMESAREQGAFLILAHPHWCANSTDDALRHPFDGVEVYNHVCRWLNGKSDGVVHWDARLRNGGDALAFAVDDSHLRPEHMGWNGGWIVVNAPDCTAEAIMQSIRTGNYYSSCGPEIKSITLDGGALHVETSPVQFARLVGPGPIGAPRGSFDGELVTELTLPVPEGWDYVYLDLEDDRGRRAWTNTLFTRD